MHMVHSLNEQSFLISYVNWNCEAVNSSTSKLSTSWKSSSLIDNAEQGIDKFSCRQHTLDEAKREASSWSIQEERVGFATSSLLTTEAILPWPLGIEGGLYSLQRSFHLRMFPSQDRACLHKHNSVWCQYCCSEPNICYLYITLVFQNQQGLRFPEALTNPAVIIWFFSTFLEYRGQTD